MYWAIPFLILATPLCLVAAWSDLKNLRIQNGVPIMLLLIFFGTGPMLLPFDQFLWRSIGLLIAFAIGILIFTTGILGGGDIKLFVAMSPFIHTGHWVMFTAMLAIASLSGVLAHKAIGKLGFAPKGWKSWEGEQGFRQMKFPFGYILAGALIFYLASNIIAHYA